MIAQQYGYRRFTFQVPQCSLEYVTTYITMNTPAKKIKNKKKKKKGSVGGEEIQDRELYRSVRGGWCIGRTICKLNDQIVTRNNDLHKRLF